MRGPTPPLTSTPALPSDKNWMILFNEILDRTVGNSPDKSESPERLRVTDIQQNGPEITVTFTPEQLSAFTRNLHGLRSKCPPVEMAASAQPQPAPEAFKVENANRYTQKLLGQLFKELGLKFEDAGDVWTYSFKPALARLKKPALDMLKEHLSAAPLSVLKENIAGEFPITLEQNTENGHGYLAPLVDHIFSYHESGDQHTISFMPRQIAKLAEIAATPLKTLQAADEKFKASFKRAELAELIRTLLQAEVMMIPTAIPGQANPMAIIRPKAEELATPQNIVVLLDISSSMSGNDQGTGHAFPNVVEGFNTLLTLTAADLPPSSTLQVIAFSNYTCTQKSKSYDVTQLSNLRTWVSRLEPKGKTALNYHLLETLQSLTSSETPADALLFFTDGFDNDSPKGNEEKLMDLISETLPTAPLKVIPVGCHDFRKNRKILDLLAKNSGTGTQCIELKDRTDWAAATAYRHMLTARRAILTFLHEQARHSVRVIANEPMLLEGVTVTCGDTLKLETEKTERVYRSSGSLIVATPKASQSGLTLMPKPSNQGDGPLNAAKEDEQSSEEAANLSS